MVERKEKEREKPLFSLRDQCKLRMKQLVQQLKQDNKNISSYLLIVDEKTIRMIGSFMKMIELIEQNILAVEQIDCIRKQYPKQHAIYILSPSDQSIQFLLDDYKTQKTSQYGVVHLFFTNKITDNIMQKISTCQCLIERLKTFKELNLDFSCKFENIFNLNVPEAFPILYSDPAKKQDMLRIVADKLSTVITSFEKINAIEILFNKAEQNVPNSTISEDIANQVHTRLTEFIAGLQVQKDDNETLDPNSGKITLLIVDRSYDPLNPLVRDFYYQPMMYDLLDIENEIVQYDGEDKDGNIIKKKAILEDNDDLFHRYRFKHIAEVMQGVSQEFQDFCNNNATAQMQKGQMQDMNLNKMSDIIKTMPQYQELLSKYTMHYTIIQDCFKIFEDKNLSEVGELEQTLTTGLNDEGKQVSSSKMMQQVGARLDGKGLNDQDKLRLILLTSISLEMSEKDRKALTDKININDQQALLNLTYLGINPQSSKKSSKSKSRIDKKAIKTALSKSQSSTLQLCRNTPQLELLVEEIMQNNKLDQKIAKLPTKFRSLQINCEQLGKNKSNSNNLQKKNKIAQILGDDDNEEMANQIPKLIVFVVGGLAYNEIRSIKNLDCLKENIVCILGGSHLMKPNDYLKGLLQMKSQ